MLSLCGLMYFSCMKDTFSVNVISNLNLITMEPKRTTHNTFTRVSDGAIVTRGKITRPVQTFDEHLLEIYLRGELNEVHAKITMLRDKLELELTDGFARYFGDQLFRKLEEAKYIQARIDELTK